MAEDNLPANVSNHDLSDARNLEADRDDDNETAQRSGSIRTRFDRTYACEECSFKTMKSKAFLEHQIETHQKAFSIFSCNLCEYASRYKTKMERHRQRRHEILSGSLAAEPSSERSVDHGLAVASEVNLSGRRRSSLISRIQLPFRRELPTESSEKQGLQEVRSLAVVINGITMHRCTQCSFTSPTRLKTSKHYRLCHHGDDNRYVCSTCSYRAPSRAEFFSHKATHSEKEFFKCPDCDYTTDSKANLDRHYSNHVVDMPHKCTICSFSSTGEGAVQRHMAGHHISIVSRASLANEPLTANGGEGVSSDAVGVKSQIGKTSPGLDALKKCLNSDDRITSPGAAVSLGCGVCGHGTNSIDDMKTHLASVHGLTASGTRVSRVKNSGRATVVEGVMEAQVDGNDTASISSSASRAKAASGESGADAVVETPEADEQQDLYCKHCSYCAKYPSELKRHEKVHTIGRRHQCWKCERSYKYSGDLTTHLRRVHSIRARVKHRKLMSKSAGDSGNDVCPDKETRTGPVEVGSKAASQRSAGANRHSTVPRVCFVPKIRRTQQPWAGTRRCPACSFATMFQSRLDAHMRTHTTLKPFRCFYCDYASFWRGDVKKHLEKHHSSQMDGVEDAYELIEYTFQMDLRKADLNRSNDDAAKEKSDEPISPPLTLTNKGARRMKITPMRRWPVEDSSKAPAETSELSASASLTPGVRPYKCSACGLRFNEISDVQKHFHLAHTSTQDLRIVLLSRDDLIALGESETDVGTYYPCESSGGGREDSDEVPSNPGNESASRLARPFVCSACGKQSRWRSNISKHVRTVHGGVPGVRIITRPGELHRQRIELAQERGCFQCSVCLVRSEVSWNIRRHIRTVHKSASGAQVVVIGSSREDDRAFGCSACSYKSNTKPNVRKHIHRVHRGKAKTIWHGPMQQTPEMLFNDMQGKSSSVKAEADDNRPLRKDTMIEPMNPKDDDTKWSVAGFRCKICGFISKWRSATRRHIRTRHGKRSAYRSTITALAKPKRDSLPAAIPGLAGRSQTAHKAAPPTGASRPAKAARFAANASGTASPGSSASMHVDGSMPMSGDTVRATTRSVDALDGPSAVPDGVKTDDGGEAEPVTQCANAEHMIWLCGLCSFDCADRGAAVDHLQAQHQLSAYRCSLCQYTSDAEADIESHILAQHESQSLAESVSKKWSRCLALIHIKTREPNLTCSTRHVALPDDGRSIGIQYGCVFGDMKTSWKSAVVRHAKERHGRDPAKSKWPLDSFYKLITKSSSTQCAAANGGSGVAGLPSRLPKSARHDLSVIVDSTSANDTLRVGSSSYVSPGRKQTKRQEHSRSVTKSVNLDSPKPKRQRMLSEHVTPEIGDKSSSTDDMEEPHEEQSGSLRKTKYKMVDVALSLRRYLCSVCPFRCKSSRDLLYHKQFHRPKSTAIHKCPKCKYWVTRRGLLKQHAKVHDPKYAALFSACPSSTGASASEQGIQSLASSSDCDASPTRDSDTEEAYSMPCDSAVELAELKERALNSRIQPVVLLLPVPPEQLQGRMECDGLTLEHGRKKFKCSSCPYAAHFPSLLVRHEWMHDRKRAALRAVMDAKRSGASEIPSSRVTEHECNLCDFACDDRKTLEEHLYVHSLDYPGFVDNEITPELAKEMQQLATQVSDGAELVSSDGGFNLKYNRSTGEYVLEANGSVTRYQCEKCPYRTFNKEHFRRHVVLHGGRQRYVCQYCDYSVPVFDMVSRHQQLHTSINPNLFTFVKPRGLPLLSFTAADKALLGDSACDLGDDFYENRPEDCVAPLESFDTGTKKKLYRCDFCPFANLRKDHVASHVKCHYIRSSFKCVYCTYSISKAYMLNEHMKLHYVPFVEPNGNVIPMVLDGETGSGDRVKLVPASEIEREYIDISEMPGEAAGEPLEDLDKDLSYCDRRRPSSGTEVRTFNERICQHCDRRFGSDDDYHDHELRHMVSMTRGNDDSEDEA